MKRSQVLQLNRCQNFKVGPGSLMLISIFVFDTFKNEYESVKEKMAIYCPQGSGTLRQQLLSMHGNACYCMVLHGIALYCIVLHGIAWYCMVLHGIAWYCRVLHGIAWYCMVLHGFAW